MYLRVFLVPLFLLFSLFFSACGGSGGGSDSPGSSTSVQGTLLTGIIVDAQISGLRYESVGPDGEKTHGTTNLKGEYDYFEGGRTTFFVGGIEVAQTTPKKMLSITTLVETPKEQENLARFLQTLDFDQNPENGIQVNSAASNALDVTELRFDDNFDADFAAVKSELIRPIMGNVGLVSTEDALAHSSKSERLSSLQETDLYKAIANEKNYTSSYYNTEVLENDQRKRVYLWIWEKILAKEMAIENELATQEFDISKVEEQRDRYKKYLDYADSVVNITSLGKGAYDQLSKAGTRTMSYELTHLSSLTVSGCDAVVKLYDVNTSDEEQLGDANLCKNMMKVLNPVGDPTSKLAIANPILSGFLPEALPVIMRYKQMNWLHFNTKSLRNLSKAKVSKPNLISIGISIASIANDSAGAYRASNINKELTTRLVAQEWLSVWFRSGFKQEYVNKLINNNATSLVGNRAQIEAIALNFGTSGALCDAYKFFNPFVDCTGIENVNYDYDKAAEIINRYLAKSNALYRNFAEMTGPISDGNAQIGVIEIAWKADENLTDVGESRKLSGKLIIHNIDGTIKTQMPENLKVRFAQCELGGGGAAYMYGANYAGTISSNGEFIIDLNRFDMDMEKEEACLASSHGAYGFQFYIDQNANNTLDDADKEVRTFSSDKTSDNNITATHIVIDNQEVNIVDYVLQGDEFITVTPIVNSSSFFNTQKLLNNRLSVDYYVDIIQDSLSFFIFKSDSPTVYNSNAARIIWDGNFTSISDDVSKLPSLKKSDESITKVLGMRLDQENYATGSSMNISFVDEKIKITNGNYTLNSRCTKEFLISNDDMGTLDITDLNDVYSREWTHIHSNSNYNCIDSTDVNGVKSMQCSTSERGDGYRALIYENCRGAWSITNIFDINDLAQN